MFGVREYLSKYSNGNYLRPFLTGSDNIAAYIFNKKSVRGPLYIGWNITFRCNCRCDYCKTLEFVDIDKELETWECIKIIKEIGNAGVALLSITGGEPLLRPDLCEIISEAKRSGICVNILTNGVLLEEQADMLIKSGLDAITVSMDSAFPEEHNTIRHHAGIFQKAEAGIRKLKRMRNKKKPRILLGLTVHKKNYKTIQAFIEYWKNTADEFVFQPIHNSLSSSIFKTDEHDLLFIEKDRNEFKDVYEHLTKRYEYFRHDYEKEFMNFFFEHQNMNIKYKCFACFFMLQIDAYGNVYPCPEFVKKVGNLREDRFFDIWNGEKIGLFRSNLKGKLNSCFCWYRCTGPINCYLTTLLSKIT